MNTTLVRTLLTLLLASALHLVASAGKGGPAGGAKSACILSADFGSGIPAGWSVGPSVEQQDAFGNGLGTFVDAWSTGASASANANRNFPVPDVPTGNTFAMANDDATPCNCAMDDVSLTSPVFDLTGVQNAAIRFRAFNNGAFGGGPGLVEASADGTNWTLIATIGAVAHTWQAFLADLSPFDGQANVQVRFRWSDNGEWAGGLAVDDICVSPRASHDLAILDAFLGDAEPTAFDATKRTLGYDQLPLEQAGPLYLKVIVLNAGSLGAISASCSVQVTLGGASQGTFTTTVPAIGAGATDTLEIATGWIPATTGRLEASISVSALSVDEEPSDNSTTRSMWITGAGLAAGNNAMALDDSTVTGAVFNDGNDYAVALRYEVVPPGSSAYAVSFLPGTGSMANGRVVGKVLDAQFNLLAVSDEHVLTQTEVDDALTMGRSVHLSFEAPLALDAGTDVYAVLEHESDSGDVTVALSRAATHGSALLYDGPGVDWDYLLSAPIVRLHLSSPEVGLNEVAEVPGTLSIAPNPADALAAVRVEGVQGGVVWSVMDLGGRQVLAGSCVASRFEVPTLRLSPGTYVLQARSGSLVHIGRLVVAR